MVTNVRSTLRAVLLGALAIVVARCNREIIVYADDPSIELSLTTVQIAATEGGADPAATQVSIENSGDGTLSGLAATVSHGAGEPTGWLSTVLSNTSTPSTLTIQASTGSLSPGTYTANVAVTSSVASNSPQNISVTFTVSARPQPPTIQLSSTSLTFNAQAGGGSPAAKTVNVTNSGGGSLSGMGISVSYAGQQWTGWLLASISGTTAPTTVTLQPSTGSLPAGTYNATVLVRSPIADNSPQNISVSFTVSAGTASPWISLSHTGVAFSAQQGGADPTAQTVSVTNSHGGTLTGLSTSVTYTGGQPTGWLSASLNTPTAPATITLQAITGTLSPGTYTATVAVQSGVASNSPQNIAVTFTVSAGPAIGLSRG